MLIFSQESDEFMIARTASEDATIEYLETMTKYLQNNLNKYTTRYASPTQLTYK